MRFVPRSFGPWLAIVTLTAAGAAAAAGYGLTAPKRYRATAQLLVTPVPASDATYTGLDLLRSGGRRTAAASAAALLRSPQVADAVRAQLGLTRSRDDLLAAVHPEVVGESDVVAITVEDTSAAGAAQLANAFADALVSQRTASFQSQLVSTIRRDEQLLRTTKGAGAAELQRRLVVLRSLQGQPDPTVRAAAQASAPDSPVWPKLPRLVGIGAGIGLAAGVLVALLGLVGRAGRAARIPGTPEYDRRVPERVVDELEARLQEQVEALVTERERLAGRESGLAQREREVSAKLDELRAAVPQQPAEPAEDGERARREEELAARVAALTQREVELARRAAAVAARERELEERPAAPVDDAGIARREEELAARVAALTRREVELARRAAAVSARERELEERPAVPADDADIARREEELAARVSALTQREVELARRAAAVAGRERELEAAAPAQDGREELAARAEAIAEREAALVAREEELAAEPPARVPAPTSAAAPEPQPAATDGSRGRWNLTLLERLVEERGREFPDRLDEWSSYLYFLREYAEADGTVPASFDWLIQDTFSELVA
jgi:hypothetical protein